MARIGWRIAGLVAVVCFLVVSMSTAYPGGRTLPDRAAAAVREAFPGATITGVEREREQGVMLYGVTLKQDGTRSEVEVSADGVIGEIETVVGLSDLPEAVADAIAKAAGSGRVTRVEKHEVRGVTRDGRLVELAEPKVVYEAKIRRNGRTVEIQVPADSGVASAEEEDEDEGDDEQEEDEEEGDNDDGDEMVTLPDSAMAAIMKAFPAAALGQVTREDELGLTLYEVEVLDAGRELEVKVAADGTLVEVESVVGRAELPAAAASAIAKAAAGGEVVKVEEAQAHAFVKLVPLTSPSVTYEAKILRDGEMLEVKVTRDGTVLSIMKDEGDDEQEGDEDEDDDEGDDEQEGDEDEDEGDYDD